VAVLLAGILVTGAFFRLFRLMSLFPILIDESIYIRWAEIIDHQGQWFISLLDAKQPLSYWIYALIRKALPLLDPLCGARLVSVCAGLLSVFLMFRLGRRLSGIFAGLLAGLFQAVMPFAVLYDRLAYTDSLVNVCGIAVTSESVQYFTRPSLSLPGAIWLGALLGIGFWVKSTFALFLWVPLLTALLLGRENRKLAAIRLFQIYGVSLLFPVISLLCVPNAPNFEVNNLLLHHTNFFPPIGFLAEHPFEIFRQNLELIGEYARIYITAPLSVAGMLSAVYLILRKRREGLLVLLIIMAPVMIEAYFLWMIHSRYLFPLVWPVAMLTALALADLKRWAALAVAAVLIVPMLFASGTILHNPRARLHQIEIDEFLSSGPYSGYGIREAVAYLKEQTRQSPITVLTDPLFGTPADAIHAYLNLWNGTRVYDAWWLQLDQPILPKQPMEVMKSQYERVFAEVVNFPALMHVYYVTDTNYNKPEWVMKREPAAKLEARFAKANGMDFIDVYRLK
jgi:4-amino-4-deoxy-L-arabinose transferase-like glycosyltransferase